MKFTQNVELSKIPVPMSLPAQMSAIIVPQPGGPEVMRLAQLPLPEIQIFGGGAHAGRRVDIQDFMVMALGAASFDDALGEVTVSETSAADVTASEVVPVMLPCFAVMVVDPAPCPVARPLLLIVATFVSELVQVTAVLMFCVDPSL